MKQQVTKRVHIVEGIDWKASIIALLESRSPYRPWRYGFGEARKGDPVAVVLHTDPRTVMTSLGSIGADGRRDRAVVDWSLPAPGLVDLDSLVMLLGLDGDCDPRDAWLLRGDAARRLEQALTEAHLRRDASMRFGHLSVAAARVLLRSGGRCTGCGNLIDLTGEDARDSFRIRTVDGSVRDAPEVLIKDERGASSYVEQGIPANCWRPTLPVDWPGVLCRACCTRMDEDGYTSLLGFRFSQHPKCPKCGAQQARAAQFGMPVNQDVYTDTPPWVDWQGCCNDGHKWTCAVCTHEW